MALPYDSLVRTRRRGLPGGLNRKDPGTFAFSFPRVFGFAS
jgi:hypothetical protein